MVNATPLGMEGYEEKDWDLTGLNREAIVVDLVYTPEKTNLLKSAEAAGHTTIGGLSILAHQAAKTFKTWFDVEPEVNDKLFEQLK